MTVTIVGVGLIGGSLGLDLKARGFARRVIGVERNPAHAELALTRGLVDEIADVKDALALADLVVLAAPVDEIVRVFPAVLDLTGHGSVVTDVGSTKKSVCDSIREHPGRGRFVASHPIAGTENFGPQAAMPHLFDDRAAILCDVGESEADAVETVSLMYRTLGMRIVRMESGVHDRHMAYVSHISHVVSFALAATVLEMGKDEAVIVDLASSGLDSTVRLAKSSPDMWTPILEQNAGFVSEALDVCLSRLARFKVLVDARDRNGIHNFITMANEIRRVLDHMREGRKNENGAEDQR